PKLQIAVTIGELIDPTLPEPHRCTRFSHRCPDPIRGRALGISLGGTAPRSTRPMMKRDYRFSRRRLLKSFGAGAALLPMLHADRADAACYVTGIKRLYMLAWTNGTLSSINTWATAGAAPASCSVGSMG